MEVTQLSSETPNRAREHFEEILAQMIVVETNTMPVPLTEFIIWLMRHITKGLNLQISAPNHSEPLRLSQHWVEKLTLDLPDGTEDWHHIPEETTKVMMIEKQLLSDYLATSVALTRDRLDQIRGE